MGESLSVAAKEKLDACKAGGYAELSLVSCGLAGVPKQLLKSSALAGLTKLNLSRNGIGKLPETLGKLVLLQELDVSYNNLSDVQCVRGLGRLHKLNVAGNQGVDTIPDLEVLFFLDISATGVSMLNAQLPVLQELYMKSLNLPSLPPQVLTYTSLLKLNLKNNRLSTMPDDVGKLAGLRKLNLSSNPLSALSSSIAALAQLEILSLSNSDLGKLPPELAGLTQLKKLKIRHARLQAFDLGMSRMKQLQLLDLSNNQLSSIGLNAGISMRDLSSLQSLLLSHNQLTALPREIGLIKSLRCLDLSDNKMASVPGELFYLSRSLDLKLANNPLTGNHLAWYQESVPELQQNLQPFCTAFALSSKLVLPAEVRVNVPATIRLYVADIAGVLLAQAKSGCADTALMCVAGPYIGKVETYTQPSKTDKSCYEIFFKVTFPGTYELNVLVYGEKVPGSPLRFMATS
eukprot:TRINITY_DN18873_c0_g1_i1.p1 TRINITY_DN18873_c0_g1~~TRINITY_DN18873_c0_g1_i1.p1  ORF type:complete len:460 (-),score=110.89 TRINITY_DN18873_c0_g1_i1:62-1441(-)